MDYQLIENYGIIGEMHSVALVGMDGVFSLGAVVLGSGRLRVAQSRPDQAIGWVLILSGVFVIVDAMVWVSVGGA